jgi:hypothetical protein
MLLAGDLESLERDIRDRVGLYAKPIVLIVKVILGRGKYANRTDKFSPRVNVKKPIFIWPP